MQTRNDQERILRLAAMTAAREAKILAVIERTQQEGKPIRPTTIWREAGGNKPRLVHFVKAWLDAHPEAAVAVLEAPDAGPDSADAYPQGPACCLTDGLPEAPARPPARSPAPRVAACGEAYRQAQAALEQAQRQVQASSVAWQEAKYAARQATAWLHERSRVARSAPAHELAAALAAVDRARDALAAYVGGGEATRAAEQLGYMPAGLR